MQIIIIINSDPIFNTKQRNVKLSKCYFLMLCVDKGKIFEGYFLKMFPVSMQASKRQANNLICSLTSLRHRVR